MPVTPQDHAKQVKALMMDMINVMVASKLPPLDCYLALQIVMNEMRETAREMLEKHQAEHSSTQSES